MASGSVEKCRNTGEIKIYICICAEKQSKGKKENSDFPQSGEGGEYDE